MRGILTNGILDESRIPATRVAKAPQKQCPACGHLQPCGTRSCKNPDGCNHIFYKARTNKSTPIQQIVLETSPEPAPDLQVNLREQSIATITAALNTVFDNIERRIVATPTPNTNSAKDAQHDEVLNIIMRGIVELSENTRRDNEILRDKIDDLNSTIIAMRGTINILRDIHKDKIPVHKPEPIVTNHNGLLAPRLKKILIIGLDSHKNEIISKQLKDKAHCIFSDSNNRNVPGADYVITTLQCSHSTREKILSIMDSKNFKYIASTNTQDVIKTALDFLSRQ